jgi:hypothetical protein
MSLILNATGIASVVNGVDVANKADSKMSYRDKNAELVCN